VSASTDSLTQKLNAMAAKSSANYAMEFNNQITMFQQRVDEEMFGTWLNSTSVLLNSTLVTFYDELESGESDPYV
jgi:hypothetical protein